MWLVKPLRRRIAVLVAIGGALSAAQGSVGCVEGCIDDDDNRGSTLTYADCAPTLRLPVSPRIMEVRDDGSVHAGPPCATANCLAGDRGAWSFRDAVSTKIEVGPHHIELLPPAEGTAPSSFAAQHAMRGFVLGRNLAIIDRGAELEVVTPEFVKRVATPTLRDGEGVHQALRLDGDQFFLWVRASKRGARGRMVALQPSTIVEPRDDASAIWNAQGKLQGWLFPSRALTADAGVVNDGVQEGGGAIQRADGTMLPLPFDVPANASSARYTAGHFIVHAGKRIFILTTDGVLVTEIKNELNVTSHEGVLYAVDLRAPGAFYVITSAGLEPLLVPRAGFDLAGVPVPEGATLQRVEIAVEAGRALVSERLRLPTCTTEDRLVLVDLLTKSARTIATGDVVRLHPTFAGDRFRFVEADASYETR